MKGTRRLLHIFALTLLAQLVLLASAATVTIDLTTGFDNGRFVFIGVGGDIDGIVNPDLNIELGDTVVLNLIGGDGLEHDLAIDEFGVQSDKVVAPGAVTTVTFRADQAGTFDYYCTIPGHRQNGMEGRVRIGNGNGNGEAEDIPSLAKNPADIPGPIGDREPTHHTVDLTTVETIGQLADGSSYTFWTFNETIPGPFIRVREGDSITVNLHNDASSKNAHSVDFHAVTGPGGGAAVTQTLPGQTETFTFTALKPGLYVYHCATPSVAHHITQGMYGMILVEPEGGFPEVDREYYVMQGELYTVERYGSRGELTFDNQKMLDEQAEYLFYNGAPNALTELYPLEAEVGETVRIFYGVGGPNYTSSFHVIGEIFDRVYVEGGDLINHNVQTTLVPAGGATMVEFQVDYPGSYILVDHSLSRAERGLTGILNVTGPADDDIFYSHPSGE